MRHFGISLCIQVYTMIPAWADQRHYWYCIRCLWLKAQALQQSWQVSTVLEILPKVTVHYYHAYTPTAQRLRARHVVQIFRLVFSTLHAKLLQSSYGLHRPLLVHVCLSFALLAHVQWTTQTYIRRHFLGLCRARRFHSNYFARAISYRDCIFSERTVHERD